MKLDRKALETTLGPDYVLKGEDWNVWLWIMFKGQRIGHLNIADGTLDSWLLIKWKSRPEGWKPFEVDLGGEYQSRDRPSVKNSFRNFRKWLALVTSWR